MNEIPSPKPQEKPIEEMGVEELVAKIKLIDEEIEDLLRRKGETKNPFIQKALDLQFADKINKKAAYEMQRQKVLFGGQKES